MSEHDRNDIIALPSVDVLKRMLQDGLDKGGDYLTPEERGDALHELASAVAVIRTAPDARRVLAIVMSGKPITYRDGQFQEVCR